MKKNILVFLLLSAIVSLSSCKKFLEEQSQTELIPKTANSLNELLLGAAYTHHDGQSYDVTLRMLDDDITHNEDFFNNTLYKAYTWQPTDLGIPEETAGVNTWNTTYPMLMACNTILEYLPKVSGSTAEIENVGGQAHLLRAYYYFMLVNYFGKPYTDRMSNPSQDLGVPLMLTASVSFEGKARSTVAEVYAQILADLDEGIKLLERNGKNNTNFRISAAAGYLLASRVHLHMGNWEKTIDAATSLLLLKSDLMDLPTWGPVNQANKPIIDKMNVESIWVFGPSTGVVYDRGVEGYSYVLSADLLNQFEAGDLRSSIYISNKRSIKRPVPRHLAKVGQAFRVSEALLNRAEAYAQLNKLGQADKAQLALNDLNTLRKKRFTAASYQDLSSTGPDDLLEKCRQEKRREFFDEEGHRWFDLRRSGMPALQHVYFESAAQTSTYTLEERDPAYVLPVPRRALDMNPKLVPNPEPAIRTGH